MDAASAKQAILTLWDHIDSIQRHGSYYDFSRLAEDTETGQSVHTTGWVKVDKPFLDGLRHSVIILSGFLVPDDPEADSFELNERIDAALEELRETWEQGQIAKAECEAERRNAEATYGTMW